MLRFNEECDVRVYICRLCKNRRRTLLVKETEGPTVDELLRGTPSEQKYVVNGIREMADRFMTLFRELDEDYFGKSHFDGLSEFGGQLKKRYPNSIDDSDITYWLAGHYLDASNATRKIKRKILLVLKQSSVCNRCDAVFRTLTEFEMDHVIPKHKGGPTALENLQLLCTKCHREKGNTDPIPGIDCSPYDNTYDVPTCIHELNCSIVFRHVEAKL